MYTVLVVVQVLVAIALVGLVLIQHGKGADAGAAFGSGASGTVFGARGAANFLTRATATLAAAFFISSLALAYLVNDRSGGGGSSVVDGIKDNIVIPEDNLEAPPPVPESAVEPEAPSGSSAEPAAESDTPSVPQ